MYIDLDKNSSEPMINQLLEQIRRAILDGTLKADRKMPSTRSLSRELDISRSTVITSYDQLIAEGYLYGIEGSGTYVSNGLVYDSHILEGDKVIKKVDDMLYTSQKDTISFRPGVPDLTSIPIDRWGKTYRDVTARIQTDQLDYHSPFGSWQLRSVLAQYLKRQRGVHCRPSNILITGGAAQAFSMLADLISSDKYAAVEDPLSTGMLTTLENRGVTCIPIPVDHEGMCTSDLPERSIGMIFVTPSHQFPTGVIMSIRRRLDLIQYATENDCYIVEDDYDSEFRYEGSPIKSMQNLAPDRVIYVGTFSKILMPAIRMGYMVLPDNLVEALGQVKYASDLHSPILEQVTLAKFIEEGLMDRHIKRMKKIYSTRRKYLVNQLQERFSDRVWVSGDGAGLHLIVGFRDLLVDDELLKRFAAHGVEVSAVGDHCMNCRASYGHHIILGFGNTDIDGINEGIKRMYETING